MLTSNPAPGELHSFQLLVDNNAPQAVIIKPPDVGPFIGVTALNSKPKLRGMRSIKQHAQTFKNATARSWFFQRILKRSCAKRYFFQECNAESEASIHARHIKTRLCFTFFYKRCAISTPRNDRWDGNRLLHLHLHTQEGEKEQKKHQTFHLRVGADFPPKTQKKKYIHQNGGKTQS